MPRKISTSIRDNLDKLRNMLHQSPEKPSSKSERKSAKSTAPSSTPTSPPEIPDGTPDSPETKKKNPGQPWYRHRQRW
jgi:hypothetical protein